MSVGPAGAPKLYQQACALAAATITDAHLGLLDNLVAEQRRILGLRTEI